MRLYLVRHGTSTGNTPGNMIGHAAHPLTSMGVSQAKAVAERLAALGSMPVYSSDLLRAQQTAEHIVAAATRVAPEPGGRGAVDAPRLDPRLRELDLGLFEGRSWDDFLRDEELNAAMTADPLHTALPGGESLSQMEDRVLAAVGAIVARHAGERATAGPRRESSAPPGAVDAATTDAAVCVVTHDGPIRVILNHYLGVSPEKWWVFSTTHGGLSLLEWSRGWVNVRFVNDTSHVPGLDGRSVAT